MRPRTARAIPRALALAGFLALPGCAGGHARAHAPEAAPPPAGREAPPPGAPPAPGAVGAPGQAPGTGAAIGAPWDTAATANGRAGQRNHVYPSGLSPIGRRLLDSLPDPQGVTVEERPVPSTASPPTPSTPSTPSTPPAQPAPAAPAAPAPPTSAPPSPGIGESGCWEVQLLVTVDRGRAEALKKRVEKQLGVAAWVRPADGLYRVRAGGCLSPDGAYDLAQAMKAKGFPEAFRVMRDAP